MGKLSRTQTLLLIGFLVIVWGVNWPLSKYALSFAPPLLFAGIRTLLGGLFLLLVAIPRYKLIHFKKTWPIYLFSAILNIILFYGLQTVGLGYMSSGLFSVIVFLQPVLLGILSWIWLGEAMYGLKIVGLVLGFVGVATISAGGLSGHISAVGIVLALGTSISWALGTVYVKKMGEKVDSIWLVTLQLIIGGLFLTILGTGVEKWSDIKWNGIFISNLLFISIFVIAMGWLVFFKLVGSGEASKVASYTFLIPLIAIITGTLFLHEPFTLYLFIGLVLIVISIYLVNRKPKKVLQQISNLNQSEM